MNKICFQPILILTSLVMILSCGPQLQTEEVETPLITMKAEGPLFEGANSATATWEFDLAEIIGSLEGSVKEAKVISAEVELLETEDLPALEKMVLEVTSKNTSMARVGLFEGKMESGQVFALNIANKQENLANAFQDGKMTFVGDFDLLEEEYWSNVQFSLKVKFEIGIK
ncbi:hypothetical protein ACFOUP_13075 [Belliella kenyensis]|uniref:Lipid/polyisoprenoid-binding YceI-like domain-containing protein n=1 Tax=Belliella kenyensis TaxID=1472724 RepID=A0ABV8EMD9_9BACT|nr:hypothetical protein [Belliella kenyensis]MCH7403781.1 hypothetical protein [Belliella kenyensis]MDN3602435.1 hypothetical protein [Belliella kenyensis]